MDDEVHIASFIVRHQPAASEAIERLVEAWPGLEIAAREAGRCILLHECGATRGLLDCIDAVQALAGVVSVNLVYHHAEPRDALEAAVKGEPEPEKTA
jgi:nitrate reductase NapD